ncbi:unnamed protein product [Caretta caretta]
MLAMEQDKLCLNEGGRGTNTSHAWRKGEFIFKDGIGSNAGRGSWVSGTPHPRSPHPFTPPCPCYMLLSGSKSQLKVITREKLQRYSEGRVTQMLVTIQFCGGEESGSDTRIKVSSEFSSVVQWLHIATAINNTKMSDSSQPQKLSQEQRLKWKVPTQMEQDSGSLKCKAPQRFSP